MLLFSSHFCFSGCVLLFPITSFCQKKLVPEDNFNHSSHHQSSQNKTLKNGNMSSYIIKQIGFSGRIAPIMEVMRGMATDHNREREQQAQQQQPPAFRPDLFSGLFQPLFPTSSAPLTPGAFHSTSPMWTAKDPKSGDWRCVCGFSNFASRSQCFGCHRPREGPAPTSIKPGDWSCACGTHNFARRTHCMTCDAPKPTVGGSIMGSTKERVLPGDWRCPGCQAHNFRSRTACLRCGEVRTAAAAAMTPTPPWNCVGCHTANDSARSQCEICGLDRPPAGGLPTATPTTTTTTTPDAVPPQFSNNSAEVATDYFESAPPTPRSVASNSTFRTATTATTLNTSFVGSSAPLRPGDWTCEGCQFTNFASRTSCKECSSPRPLAAGAPLPRPTQKVLSGDWTCLCGFHNFARRQRCGECNKIRPVGASVAVQ